MRRRNFFRTMGIGSLASLSPRETKEFFLGERTEKEQKENDIAGGMDAWVDINLDHIAYNFNQIKKHVKVPIMAVVKANAYGHGLVEISRALEKAGTDWLMVGKLQEAIELRKAGIRSPILNFGPLAQRDCEKIISHNISQSVYSDEARHLDESAAKLEKKALIHVDVDTGMSRTGVVFNQALPLIAKLASLAHITIEGISTTLTEDTDFDREQIKRLNEVCSAAEKRGIRLGLRHAASSAGILDSPQFFLDMVRPGIALYGYYPNAKTQKQDLLNLKPALKLSARIIFIKDLFPGDSLSYHRIFKAQKRIRVATVGIGYSDGYAPQLGGRGHVLIRNRKYGVMGAVTSNHTMIDLNNDPEVQVGDEVTLIDNQKSSGLTADVLAELCGLSDYRLLIGLNPLLPKKYAEI